MSAQTAWIYVLIAGALEVVWALTMKASHGFTKPVPTLITLAAMVVSFLLLSTALRTLPVGTAYAVWTGVGAFGTAVIGILFLGEPATLVRVVSLCLIVLGIVGLKIGA